MSETSFLRQSQVVTTFGPGALVDLPDYSVIVSGLNQWTRRGKREIHEPRLVAKLRAALAVPVLQLFTPPACDELELRTPGRDKPRVSSFVPGRVFPTWFVTQEPTAGGGGKFKRRRLVGWGALDRGRYRDPEDGDKRKQVVPIRFVCGCPKGHIDDVDWRTYVHKEKSPCARPLWIEERGTSGDVADVVVGCDCRLERPLYEALKVDTLALGFCNGKRPWLGHYGTAERCTNPNRLLVRNASNAYFPERLSVISLPDRDEGLAAKIDELWDVLSAVTSVEELTVLRKMVPKVRAGLEGESDEEIVKAIRQKREGPGEDVDVAVKQAEFDVLDCGKPRIGRDTSESPFLAQTLNRAEWDPNSSPLLAAVDKVVLIHRLREVIAQVGFTRFDSASTDEKGELDVGVERAMLDVDLSWLPAVEHRGEGVFIQLSTEQVERWKSQPAVQARAAQLSGGFDAWKADRKQSRRTFPGPAYVMLHSLSHLLLTAIALDCGYPASSLRERVYGFDGRYGILIHTGSSDADGTLGGLVEAGRRIGRHFEHARELATLCSNDPVCASHAADDPNEHRFLHGAACHGCLLIAETSCENRNDLLDRTLVFPTVADSSSAFFGAAMP